MTKNYVGIDVCEKKLDIFIHPSKKYVQFNNTQQGIMQLYEYLKAFEIELIIIEATSKLEALCADISKLQKLLKTILPKCKPFLSLCVFAYFRVLSGKLDAQA